VVAVAERGGIVKDRQWCAGGLFVGLVVNVLREFVPCLGVFDPAECRAVEVGTVAGCSVFDYCPCLAGFRAKGSCWANEWGSLTVIDVDIGSFSGL
jgi:hypothetical protein